MPHPNVWACPVCGFHVLNRRCPDCESCGAALPESFRYSETELQAMRADALAQVETSAQAERELREAQLARAKLVGGIAQVVIYTGRAT